MEADYAEWEGAIDIQDDEFSSSSTCFAIASFDDQKDSCARSHSQQTGWQAQFAIASNHNLYQDAAGDHPHSAAAGGLVQRHVQLAPLELTHAPLARRLVCRSSSGPAGVDALLRGISSASSCGSEGAPSPPITPCRAFAYREDFAGGPQQDQQQCHQRLQQWLEKTEASLRGNGGGSNGRGSTAAWGQLQLPDSAAAAGELVQALPPPAFTIMGLLG